MQRRGGSMGKHTVPGSRHMATPEQRAEKPAAGKPRPIPGDAAFDKRDQSHWDHVSGIAEKHGFEPDNRVGFSASSVKQMVRDVWRKHGKENLDTASGQIVRHLADKEFKNEGYFVHTLDALAKSNKLHGEEHTEKVIKAMAQHGVPLEGFEHIDEIAGKLNAKFVLNRYSKKNVLAAYKKIAAASDF